MKNKKIAIMHYSAPPVIGGVEAVIDAHTQVLIQEDFSVAVISGRGHQSAFPPNVPLIIIPELDTQNSNILELNKNLEKGIVPEGFNNYVNLIESRLAPILANYEYVISHNVFTKHFNLPLTAALHNLLDQKIVRHLIAWCHDFTWSSPNSRNKVFPGYPWDLLRTYRDDVTYVVVSKERQIILANLFNISADTIHVIYNGIDIDTFLGLSTEGRILIKKMGLLESTLNLLMPVRVTQAKNIEYAMAIVSELKNLGESPRLVLTGPPDPHDHKNMEYYHSLLAKRQQLGIVNEMNFVYESGSEAGQPYTISNQVVGDLFRISDVMFMPSHREGFGMPVLEAGIAGIPVVSTSIPASEEIGVNDVLIFDLEQPPKEIARKIIHYIQNNPSSRMRKKVRKSFTWQTIFDTKILPLLK
jgi:glycosyltransferase involved in cell wall biosynthesis